MRTPSIKKIVVLGPESTGKTTLCTQLAEHYNTIWVREYAREYLQRTDGKYNYEDLLEIAKGQIRNEEKGLDSVKNDILIIDTDMNVMKVWCEYVFNECHEWILDQLRTRSYDLYLLCNPDLPWVKDELREYPDLKNRLELYSMYKQLMESGNLTWVDISGDYEQRLQTAIDAIDTLRSKKS